MAPEINDDQERILKKYQQGTFSDIPRLENPSDRELEKYFLEARTPFIASGRVASWKARNWSFEHFRDIAGSSMVNPLVNLPAEGNPYFWNDKNYYKKMALGEVIDIITQRPEIKCYLGQKEIQRYPGAENDFNFADILHATGNREPFTSVWLGSKDTHSGLHFDRRDNIFVQVVGRKFVILAAPDQARYLYPIKDMIEKSAVDPSAPDFDAHPKLKNARLLTGIVGPGDFMFIPRLWWHYLRSLDPVISLNHWYGEEIPLTALFKVISAGGIGHWRTTIVDGIVHGMLKQPYNTRLLSDMPSGVIIYKAIADGVSRRIHRGSRRPDGAHGG